VETDPPTLGGALIWTPGAPPRESIEVRTLVFFLPGV
jgi:hypothetical protein